MTKLIDMIAQIEDMNKPSNGGEVNIKAKKKMKATKFGKTLSAPKVPMSKFNNVKEPSQTHTIKGPTHIGNKSAIVAGGPGSGRRGSGVNFDKEHAKMQMRTRLAENTKNIADRQDAMNHSNNPEAKALHKQSLGSFNKAKEAYSKGAISDGDFHTRSARTFGKRADDME